MPRAENRVEKALDVTKPRRLGVIFFFMALLGINLEVLDRSILVRDLVGHCVSGRPIPNCTPDLDVPHLRDWSLAGWSSLWMLPIYGVIGMLLGLANEGASRKRSIHINIDKWPMALQCLICTAIILSIEFGFGWLVNIQLKLAIWNYDGIPGGDLYGQICTMNAFVFFFLCPLGFWLDDMIRWIGYNEDKPRKLCWYYKRLIHFRQTIEEVKWHERKREKRSQKQKH